jgi:quercetin dioxygenase-like cupin family protein
MYIDLKDLGACLAAYRRYCGVEDLSDIEARLKQNATSLRIGSLQALEQGRVGGEYTLAELKPLLAAYDMSELMIDHLLVKDDAEYIVQQSIADFTPHPATSAFESRAAYSIPRQLLRSGRGVAGPFPHAFFVRVELPNPGDTSERHHHPGDELTICRKGTVRMTWDALGVHTDLNPGDYVHFYADQRHTATNIGDGAAEVFVIRNYMIAEGGPRRQLLQHAERFDHALLHARKDKHTIRGLYKEGVGRWITQTVRALSGVVDESGTIRDSIGLARQLERMGWYGRKLHRAATHDTKQLPLARYEEIMAGFFKQPGTKADLDHLSSLCKVPPPLLYTFMFPRTPGMCVVRFDRDFLDLPGTNASARVPVHYLYPKHNLADSGLTICRLDLDPYFSSQDNKHSGTELSLLIKGDGIRADIDVPKLKSEGRGLKWISKVAVQGEYVHYVSSYEHKVTNCGRQRASVLVVRFFTS